MTKKTYRGYDLKQTAKFYNNFDFMQNEEETTTEEENEYED